MNRRCITVALGVLVFTPPQWAQSAFSGAVSGRVQGEDGSVISTGIVTLQHQDTGPNVKVPWTSKTQAIGPGGSFLFDRLGAGLYRLCVQVPNSTWLGTCDWGRNPPAATLSRQQPSANLLVRMKKGVAVPVRVDDPGQLLVQHEGKTPGAHLLIGIGNDAGMFLPAVTTSRDAGGRNQQIVIPYDSPVKVVVNSGFFRLADQNGNAIAKTGTGIPVLVPAGSLPTALLVKVTGVD